MKVRTQGEREMGRESEKKGKRGMEGARSGKEKSGGTERRERMGRDEKERG